MDRLFGLLILIWLTGGAYAQKPQTAKDSVKAGVNAKTDSAAPKDTLPGPAPASPASKKDNLLKFDDAAKARMQLMGDKIVEKKAPAAGPSNTSKPFVLNTLDFLEGRTDTKPNDDQAPVFKGEYLLPDVSHVRVGIVQKEQQVRRLVEEDQFAGTHPVYWDGVSDFGAKLFGDFVCVVNYRERGKSEEKSIRIKFSVDR